MALRFLWAIAYFLANFISVVLFSEPLNYIGSSQIDEYSASKFVRFREKGAEMFRNEHGGIYFFQFDVIFL